jgi:hypothetical protein
VTNYLPSFIVSFALIGCSMVNTDQPDRINVFPRDTEPQVRTFVEREFLQIITVTESPGWRPTVYFGAHRSRLGRGDLWPMGHSHGDKSGPDGHDE